MSGEVAPHAGAWIETTDERTGSQYRAVAPHAGAWIETIYGSAKMDKYDQSPPTRGRGLKL